MIKVHIESSIPKNTVEIWIYDEKADGERYFAKPVDLVFEKRDRSQMISPTFEVSNMHAPHLLTGIADALVESGYRDKKKDDKSDVSYHLEDMRKIVFEVLKEWK